MLMAEWQNVMCAAGCIAPYIQTDFQLLASDLCDQDMNLDFLPHSMNILKITSLFECSIKGYLKDILSRRLDYLKIFF